MESPKLYKEPEIFHGYVLDLALDTENNTTIGE